MYGSSNLDGAIQSVVFFNRTIRRKALSKEKGLDLMTRPGRKSQNAGTHRARLGEL